MYSILEMVGNMQEHGLMENNVVLEYIIRVKTNIELECGKMDKELNGLRMKKWKVIRSQSINY